jgi:hypothetical protein
MNAEKIMRPREVVGPRLPAWMKQRREATRECVERFNVNEFAIIAPLAGEREV